MTKRTLVFLLLILGLSSSLMAMPAQILLIRHGEKPTDGNQLSPQGWLRAKAIPNLFNSRPEFTQFGLPVALFAMSPEKTDGSVRAIQTLKYLSKNLNLTIDSDFTRDQISELVEAIKNNHSYDGKMILICWEHEYLREIAFELGLQDNVQWPGTQFDRVWVLNFSPNGDLIKFQNLPQKLLPTDSVQ